MRELALTLPDGTKVVPPVPGMPTGGILDKTLPAIITYMFVGATLLAFLFLIFGGVKWITSGGDKTGVESARKTITFAIIGLVVVLSSYLIINGVGMIFSVNLFGFR